MCYGVCFACDGLVVEIGEVGGGEANDLGGCVCDTEEFVFVGGSEHVKETGRAVEENGLDDALVEQQQEVGGNGEGSEFPDGRESLLATFMDISDVLIEAQFIVQGESEVFVALYSLYCYVIDVDGIMGGAVD